MTRKKRIFRCCGVCLARLVLLAIAVAAGCTIYVLTHGFPDWAVRAMTQRVSGRSLTVEAESIRPVIGQGIELSGLRVYSRGMLGPPAAQAATCALSIEWPCLFRGEPCIRNIHLQGAVFRPKQAFGGKRSRYAPSPMFVDTGLLIEQAEVDNVQIDRLECRLQADGHLLSIGEFDCTFSREGRTGRATGSMRYGNRERYLEGVLDCTMNPRIVLPLLDRYEMEFTAKLIRRFEFGPTPPRSQVSFKRMFGKGRPIELGAEFWVQECRYRDEPILRVDGRLNLHSEQGDTLASMEPLLVARRDGIISGGFVADSAARTVAFDGISTIQPKSLARIVGIGTNGFLARCEFRGPVSIAARGQIDYGGWTNTQVRGRMGGRDLRLMRHDIDEWTADIAVDGCTNRFENIAGRAYGGEFHGRASCIRPPPGSGETNVPYQVEGIINGADLARVLASVSTNAPGEMTGRFSAKVALTGVAPDKGFSQVRGTGSIRMKHGRVFTMPLFGGLSSFLRKIVPGLDFVLRQTDLISDFEIGDGRVHTDRVGIEGGVLSLAGNGEYRFDRTVDFDVQVKLMKQHTLVAKLLRALTYPISKLFEFRVKGPLSDPVWYPVNFSTDLLERIGLTQGDDDDT